MTKSNSPQRCTSGSAFNLCVLQKRPKIKKCVTIKAIENAKLKLSKLLSSYNNALCESSKPFYNNQPWRHAAFGYSPQSVAYFLDLDGSVSICPKVLSPVLTVPV